MTLRHRMLRFGKSAVLPLWVMCFAVPSETAIGYEPPPVTGSTVQPPDPMSMIPGSNNAWSVSRIATGCYLISPRRTGSSSLAIGRNIKLGLGLFLVNLPLAAPIGGPRETVVVRAEDTKVIGAGQIVGRGTLFVPLTDSDTALSLQELRDTGTLWVMLRHTWIAHDGQGILPALADYGRTCTADNARSG